MSRILFFIVFFFTFVIQNSYAEILKEAQLRGITIQSIDASSLNSIYQDIDNNKTRCCI